MSNNRTIHDVLQGTAAWLKLREGRFTASEAPAMMGVSKYTTRTDLLRSKATGMTADPGAVTQRLFDAGHAAEAKARPLAEDQVGGDLYPVTVTAEIDNLPLLASLDGLTMDEFIAWETKLWNETLAAHVRAGTLPEQYTVQMDQQLLVTGADRCLFSCTDGTPERFVSCWYESTPEKFAALLAGWKQFATDLAAFTLPPAAEAAPVGKSPDTLPALRIEVTGEVTASNLSEFKQTALAAIQSVNRSLTTDQDFADAAKAVKWCSDIESRIAAAKEHALSQTATIDALFKALDDISGEARRVRLDLDKLVTRRKTEVKEEAVTAARRALDAHIADLNGEIAPMRLQPVLADFAGAIKGMRSIDSMQAALDLTLATAKIAADTQARGIRANLSTFEFAAAGHETLFADLQQLIHKHEDDFFRVLDARITAHKAAAELAAQRAESERLERLAEANRQALQRAQVVAVAPAPAPAAVAAPAPVLAPPAPRADEPATLKLGDINARLHPIRLDAAGMAELGVSPARTEGAAKLYRESDFARLLRSLAKHLDSLQAVPA